jgi:hypothetical protein
MLTTQVEDVEDDAGVEAVEAAEEVEEAGACALARHPIRTETKRIAAAAHRTLRVNPRDSRVPRSRIGDSLSMPPV